MMEFHVFYSSNGKDSSQRCKLSHWCKGLSVIQMGFLREALCHNPCLVPFNRPIRIFLNLKDPLRSHPFSALRRSEEHTSELQSLRHLVCRLLLDKKNKLHVHLATVQVRHVT